MRHPHLPEALSEALIQQLVHTFYARIRQDLILGPIFESRIGHRWDEHLANMVDFWSSVTMMTGRYSGKPHVAHQTLGLTPDHFQRWLALFEACVSEICAGHAAAFFVDRAHRIADSLQIGLNIGSNALHFPAQKETSDARA